MLCSIRQVAVVLIAAVIFAGSPALAQAPVPPTAPAVAAGGQAGSVEDLQRLLKTLEDPAAVAQLSDQIRGLIAAQRATTPTPPLTITQPTTIIGAALSRITASASRLSTQIASAAEALRDLPQAKDWIIAQFTDPERLNRWVMILSKITAIIVAASLASHIMRRLLAKPRAALDQHGTGPLSRWSLALGRILLDMLPVAAFAAAGYVTLPLIEASRVTTTAAIAVLDATVLVRAIMVVASMILSPHAASIRPVPLSDETAAYLNVWTRRLVSGAIIGTVVVEALSMFGAPDEVSDLLLRLIGLIILAMVIVLILQNRAGVAQWLRGPASATGELPLLRRRLADTWHVLLILYVFALFTVWAFEIRDGLSYLLRSTGLTVAILVVTRFLVIGLRRAINRGFAVSGEMKAGLPGLEARANSYLPVLHAILKLVVYCAVGILVLQVWGVDSFSWVMSDVGRRISGSLVAIGVVLALCFTIWEVLSSVIERYLAETDMHGVPLTRSARVRTLLPLLRNALMILLIVLATLTVMAQFGVDIAPLLAGAGVVGLAIGFGAQTLVKDVITGLFILFEDTISVGDVVEVDGRSGSVESLTIRTLRLRDASGAVHTVPFSTVGAVRNLTKIYSYAVISIGVSYDADLEQVFEALREVDRQMRATAPFNEMILEPISIDGVDRFTDAAVIVSARIKTIAARQWAVGREFNLRIKHRFDQAGIAMPPNRPPATIPPAWAIVPNPAAPIAGGS